MKLAILNIHYGKVERGAEIWTGNLASQLSKTDNIDIFSISPDSYEKLRNIHIRFVPLISSGIFYHLSVLWFTVLCLPSLLKKKYDWIIPVNGRFQSLLIGLLKFILKYKILLVGHAGIGREDRINILFGNPDCFVALSKKAKVWAEKIIKNGIPVFYIPNGVNTGLFAPVGEKESPGLKSPVLISVSELLPYKRIRNLILAVARIKNLSLLLIGKGILDKEIDRLGTSLLLGRYKRIASVRNMDLPKYYRSAQLFSLPSRESEAFGNVYLEAISCNLPIVAPDDINRRDILNGSAIYTDVENESEFAGSIKLALITDFGNVPRNRALKYSWESVAKDYRKILLQK